MVFMPEVLEAQPGQRLRWRGRLFVRGLFDGEHDFRLEEIDHDRTRLTQAERFSGLLVPLFGKLLRRSAEGFEAMDLALKERAGSGTTRGSPGRRPHFATPSSSAHCLCCSRQSGGYASCRGAISRSV